MATEADIELFLQTATKLPEGSAQGDIAFDPTGGEGGIPTLTVKGGEATTGLLPGTEQLIEQKGKKRERPLVERDVITTELGEKDPISGLPTLTARTEKKLAPKPESLLERALGTTAGIATFAVLESFGVPTRALAATVKDVNPFASKADKGKTWDEVFAEPDSGIFKAARDIVRASDINGATKFLIEMGISTFEDPLLILGGLIGAGKSAVRQGAARNIIKKTDTELLQSGIKPAGEILGPAGKVDQAFTPAQRELVATGKVRKSTAKKEQAAIKRAPEVKREIDAGRSENVVNSIENIRERNGLTNTEGVALFESVEGDVGRAVSTYKTEVNQLYKGVNDIADPSIIGAETKQVVNDEFARLGIKPKPTKNELLIESERLIRDAQENRFLTFRDGRPFNSKTQEFLDTKAIKTLTLGPSDLGISPAAFNLLHTVRNSLQRDVPLKVLRKNKTTIQSAIQVARRAGDNGSVAVLEQSRDALKQATRTQIDEVIGNPALTSEWMLADDFLTQNASGVKAAGGLMYDKAGNARSATAIMREFNKVPTTKKGRVIETMMDFFDEEGLKNLRNLYFNDIIERAGKDGFTGKKLRNVINSQPEVVFNKVFTKEMKDDMSQLLADAISDDLGKSLTRAKLGTFTAADKQSFIKTIFSNPAYRIWATTRGFTRVSLKGLSTLATAGILTGMLERKATTAAATFLRTTDKQGLADLTFSALREGTFSSLRTGIRGGRVVPTVTQRNIPLDQSAGAPPPAETGNAAMEAEIEKFLQGVQ